MNVESYQVLKQRSLQRKNEVLIMCIPHIKHLDELASMWQNCPYNSLITSFLWPDPHTLFVDYFDYVIHSLIECNYGACNEAEKASIIEFISQDINNSSYNEFSDLIYTVCADPTLKETLRTVYHMDINNKTYNDIFNMAELMFSHWQEYTVAMSQMHTYAFTMKSIVALIAKHMFDAVFNYIVINNLPQYHSMSIRLNRRANIIEVYHVS